jgi:hypothetical protein
LGRVDALRFRNSQKISAIKFVITDYVCLGIQFMKVPALPVAF